MESFEVEVTSEPDEPFGVGDSNKATFFIIDDDGIF